MNIGAERISDHGGYFAWGETGNKDDYSWSTYLHGISAEELIKYSYDDNKIALEASDDAAINKWGQNGVYQPGLNGKSCATVAIVSGNGSA